MIVVEGCDGAGKSTLIERLVKDLDIELQPKVVDSDAEAMTDLVTWTSKDLQKGFGRRLYDRHRLISEPIYGPLLRGTLEAGFEDATWLATKFHRFYEIEPIIIICMPPITEVLCNVKDDKANRVVWKRITAIYWLYYVWWCEHKDICWLWDYTSSSAEAQYEVMIKSISHTLQARCS